jgi:hypothetical protein
MKLQEVFMGWSRQSHIAGGALVALALMVAMNLPVLVRAAEPTVLIQMTGGENATYPVAEITRIDFEGEETLVVVTESGTDSYALGMVRRIEFLWESSNIDDVMDAAAMIDAIHLFQNQPNPFSLETRIGFELPDRREVELEIYSADGRLVRTLVAGERPAGRHTMRWDGLDNTGRAVAGGVYFYNLRAPGIDASRRMILLP